MIIIDVPEKNKTLFFPEELAECDYHQFADMAKLIYQFNSGEITYHDFKILSVYSLLGLRVSKRSKQEDSEKWENIYKLSAITETFFDLKEEENGETTITLKNYDINNKLPKYRMFRTYFGPEDGFMNINYGQYSDGLEEFITYSQTGDLHSLRLLFAIFYLPKNWRGKFEVYDKESAKQRANKIFIHTDIRHLYGFYLLFDAFQKYTTSGAVTVFGQEIDLEIIYEDVGGFKSSLPGIGAYGTVNDLAESGVFGTADGVRSTNFWRVALQLYALKKKSIDEITQSKSNGST